jgi:hypothetical protein
MNVENEAEAALFPGKEYISGIFVAVYTGQCFAKKRFHSKFVDIAVKYVRDRYVHLSRA